MLPGTKASRKTRAKMRAAHLARWKKNRRRYLVECIYIHRGAKRSTKTRRLMSQAHKEPTIKDSKGRVWATSAEAARKLGLNHRDISRQLREPRRTVGGLKFTRV
jgi:hypothetical protein